MFPRFLETREEREGKFEWQRKDDRRQVADNTEKFDEALLSDEEKHLFRELVEKTGLKPLLNIPMITLSNGQMRRARIVKAVLKKPELLLLDEPLTGLDVENRLKILELLKELHAEKKPRIIMGLRVQDDIPDWITHVAFADKNKVRVGEKEEVLKSLRQHVTELGNTAQVNRPTVQDQDSEGRVVVNIEGANVQYGQRKVLNNISWTIHLGERWHLKGANGSGKSTLLSLLTGAHPLSYSLPRLELFGQKRHQTPTPLIQSRVGEMSPEMFDAFPRRMPGMSVWAVVGTGFEGAFIEKGTEGVGVQMSEGGLGVGIREEGANDQTWGGVKGESWDKVKEWRIKRCWEVLESLGPAAWDRRGGPSATSQDVSLVTKEFAQTRFTELSAGEQRVVLVMRALVGRPPLVLLDEALSGMSDGMVRAVKHHISCGGVGNDQALVAVTHWDEELPFAGSVKVFALREGARARPGVE
ncbi:hypothetical protein AX14_014007 [Amanita brunnescens Koide BX004]|nr:hypothetical protein AX14_014007 [Amanita brunnescens Koide BX004]